MALYVFEADSVNMMNLFNGKSKSFSFDSLDTGRLTDNIPSYDTSLEFNSIKELASQVERILEKDGVFRINGEFKGVIVDPKKPGISDTNRIGWVITSYGFNIKPDREKSDFSYTFGYSDIKSSADRYFSIEYDGRKLNIYANEGLLNIIRSILLSA